MIRRLFVLGKRIVLKIFQICSGCTLLYKTNWYKNLFFDDVYPGNYWYREHSERNFDLINLGSSGGKFAFDYNGFKVKGMNWAQQPQTLLEDYNELRNFHSILRKGGYVLIVIMPFTSLNKQTGVYDALKYLKIACHEPIECHLYDKATRYAQYPILMGKPAIKALARYLLGKDVPRNNNAFSMVEHNPMTIEQLEKNAKHFVDGWKQQFNIEEFDAPLTEENKKGRAYRIELMRTIIDFCTERSYRPVYIIPPVTYHLSKYYTDLFLETYIYSYLKEVNRNVVLLDYSKSKDLLNDDLYFNSFFLNKRGRELFTKKVLTDIGLI